MVNITKKIYWSKTKKTKRHNKQVKDKVSKDESGNNKRRKTNKIPS